MPADPMQQPARVEPPFYGTGPLITWEPGVLIDAVDRDRLFEKFSLGLEQSITSDRDKMDRSNFDSALKKVFDEILSGNLLEPVGLYGIFPVITDDDQVIILDPSDFCSEQVALRFPRLEKNGNCSLADCLLPEGDVIGIQMVTIGGGVREKPSVPGARPDPRSMVRNALADHLVEAIADRVTLEITRAVSLPSGTGQRVGFGSPGMPGPEEQKGLFELLAIEERLGVSLSGTFQPVPADSSLGIYFHQFITG